MNKLLIITEQIGNSAAGIVSEEWVKVFLNNDIKCQVVCKNFKTKYVNEKSILKLDENISTTQLNKVKYIIFNRDVSRDKWIKNIFKKYIEKIVYFNPDKILVIAAGQTDSMLRLGNNISNTLNKSYHVHYLDAIPAPECWGVNPLFRNAIKKSIDKYYNKSYSISATNETMLKYLNNLYNKKPNIVSDVIYNPAVGDFNNYKINKNYALYLGNLSKVRNGKTLFEAMSKIAVLFPNFNFIFAGNNKAIITSSAKHYGIDKNIKIYDYIENTDEILKYAKILIDIDIESEGDVFISSKFNRYLNTNKPILNISSSNSPTAKIIKEFNSQSIISVRHCTSDIIDAISYLIQFKMTDREVNKRAEIARRFNINNLYLKLYNILKSN